MNAHVAARVLRKFPMLFKIEHKTLGLLSVIPKALHAPYFKTTGKDGQT